MASRRTDGNRFSDGVPSAVVLRALAPIGIIASDAMIAIIIRQTTR